DGYTQQGASANTLPAGDDAVLMIELDGTSAGASADGLTLTAGGSTVRGLVINRFGGSGIILNRPAAVGHLIEGNFLGTDATGTAPLGNGSDGVLLENGATGNTIGGTTASARNVISGNTVCNVLIQGTGTDGNRVQGNSIGTNAAGTATLGSAMEG